MHPDPFVLEAELLRRIAEAKATDPLAAVLVVVPTRRLAAQVQRRIARRFAAILGVEVLQYRNLARAILSEASLPAPDVADEVLLGRLLDGPLDRLRRNPLAALVRERPGARRALLRSLADLREAGVHPDRLAEANGALAPLAEVARAYDTALASRRHAGLADDAVLMAEALPHAGPFAARRAAVFHHGAYDLIGVHLDLVREMDRSRKAVLLLPIAPGSPATAFAEAFARRFLLDPGEAFEAARDAEGGLLGQRLGALYDESASPPALPEGTVSFLHAQGASAEAETVARLALADAAGGIEPAEVAVLARTSAPYATAIEETIAGSGLFDAEIAPPLRAQPEVRDFVLALRAAVDDFPRAATAEALASSLVRWDDAPGFPGAWAEAWSRKAAVTGTLAGWRERLASWAAKTRHREDAADDEIEAERRGTEARTAAAGRIAAALETFARELDAQAPRTWCGHARHLEGVARRRIVVDDAAPGGAEPLLAAIRGLAKFETALGESGAVPLAAAVAALEAALDGTRSQAPGPGGGIAVLDAMQARALTFERVCVMGWNTGLFPQAPREDPFLDDDARRAIREATGRPLAVKRDAESEERQLLVSMLGAARTGLRLSWQRADDKGAAKAPSLALREVARVALGEADLERVRRAARSLPAHPLLRLESLAAWTGLLRPDEAIVLAALASDGGDAAVAGLAAREPALAAGLEMLAATESFAPRSMAYDGRVRRDATPAGGYSASSLGTLGRCPLQFFFRHVLGIRPLDEEASPFEEEARRVGEAIHALLERLYTVLRDEGLFESGDAGSLLARARGLLPRLWEEIGPERGRSPLAVLRGVHDARWLATIDAFLRDDLPRIVAAGRRPDAFEHAVRAAIPVPGGPLDLHGRFDRVLTGGDGAVIGDYKTSGSLAKHADKREMLAAQSLQVPLYYELAAATLAGSRPAAVEILGAGPDHGAERVEFSGFPDDAMRRGFSETLATLRDLAASGTFPLHVDKDGVCAWCDYARACRRTHVPTQQRDDVAPDGADYRDTLAKTTRKPSLADVRRGSSTGSPS